VAVAIGATREEAAERFLGSQIHTHLTSLRDSTMRGKLDDDLVARNLVGTADEICQRVAEYADAGVGTLAGLLFAADTVEETVAQMTAFADEVIPRFTT
jgi:alkanesulfonate monooxygenase SsuD/methylene tetrahydromethanopterin reductase-like flavin-dependent oxidoreductase (luciferase family)